MHASKRSAFRCLVTITLPILLLAAMPCNAALIWFADASSYTAGQAVITNTTGDDNTFTAVANSTANIVGEVVAHDGSSDGMTDGLSFRFGVSHYVSGSRTLRLEQTALGEFGADSELVVSLDRFSPDTRFESNFRDMDGGRADSGNHIVTGYNQTMRITMVMNQSGSSITLPGTLGSLATGNSVSYYKVGETYTLMDTRAVTDPVSGVALGNTQDSAGGYQLFDNIGVWDSASDTWNGTSVLELDFGTVIPEPSTTGLVLTGLLAGFIAKRRRR